MFWCGAAMTYRYFKDEAGNGAPDYRIAECGTYGQMKAALALHRFTDENRRSIANVFHDRDALTKEEWWMYYRGAISAARAAQCLSHAGLQPLVTTPKIDRFYRIDLLARVPDEVEGQRYLGVQVKSTSDHMSSCRLISTMAARERTDIELLQRIYKFTNGYNIRCTLALMIVGRSDDEWSIQPSPSLTTSFAQLIAELDICPAR